MTGSRASASKDLSPGLECRAPGRVIPAGSSISLYPRGPVRIRYGASRVDGACIKSVRKAIVKAIVHEQTQSSLAAGRSSRDSGPAHPIHIGADHGPRGPSTSHQGPPGQPCHGNLTPLSLEESMELLNGCASDALVRNSFALVHIVATGRYLQLKIHELLEALLRANELANDERVARRSASPAVKPVTSPTRHSWHCSRPCPLPFNRLRLLAVGCHPAGDELCCILSPLYPADDEPCCI
jgi:hypothetical protein